MEHTIDLDKLPNRIIGELKIHIKGGQFAWSPEKVELYIPNNGKYKNLHWETYSTLKEELKDLPVFNACLMDYLLDNQSLIPKEWESKEIVFWGTHFFCFAGYMSGMMVFSMRYVQGKWIRGDWSCDCSSTAIPVLKGGE